MRGMTGILHTGNGVARLDFSKCINVCIDKCVRLVPGSDENAIGLIALHARFEPD